MDKRAIVAMSGGVDSSVAALLVQQAGYEAVGVTLRLHGEGQGPDPAEDARAAAARLGLDFQVLDFRRAFGSRWWSGSWPPTSGGRRPTPASTATGM